MDFILSLAIMLIVARIFGEITKRMNLPALIGYLIAGIQGALADMEKKVYYINHAFRSTRCKNSMCGTPWWG